MRRFPSYQALVSNYPNKHNVSTKVLLDQIGGQVRSVLSDAVNTCAIRVSYALNRSGAPIEAMAGIYTLKGASPKPKPGLQSKPPSELYILRVLDMKNYLSRNYGPGKLIYNAKKSGDKLIGRTGPTQGIILFQWNGPFAEFGATGHVDLFQISAPNPESPMDLLAKCEGACYWMSTTMPMEAFFWQLPP